MIEIPKVELYINEESSCTFPQYSSSPCYESEVHPYQSQIHGYWQTVGADNANKSKSHARTTLSDFASATQLYSSCSADRANGARWVGPPV